MKNLLTPARTSRPAFVLTLGVYLASAAWLSLRGNAAAQDPLPTPGPIASPSVILDLALYRPQTATVQVATAIASISTAVKQGTSAGGASADGSVTSVANAVPALVLQVSAPDLFSPTSLAAQPQPATVSLAYNLACAGFKVLVAPLDGGTINGGTGGQIITVGADGTLSFTFQAPAGPGRYHVVTRLGTAEMAFPFDVAAPATAGGN